MLGRFIGFSLLPLVGACVAGCAIKPVQFAGTPDAQCSAIRSRVSIDPPAARQQQHSILGIDDKDDKSDIETRDPLAAKIIDAYREEGRKDLLEMSVGERAVSPSMLFLSGGSENGAFGAGLLSAWAAEREKLGRPPGLPPFRVVTGISTGALQSTFAFLGDTATIERRYTIAHESELLHPFTRSGLKGGSLFARAGAAKAILRKGALAELQPLREQLHELIDDNVLERVANERRKGRFLIVGAVEMDSGDAYAFDLTDAATRYARGKNPAMKDCYVEALLASSSVPMAALPVFIDGRMYIDGGARFGILSDHMAAIFEAAAPHIGGTAPKNLFIIVNGTLEAATLCGLKECPAEAAAPPSPDVAATVPMHAKWSFDGLAFRSLAVLINQSYRSSVYWSSEEAKKRGFDPHFVRIDGKALAAFEARANLPPEPDAVRSCAYWRALDVQLDRPLEFHPRFMRCEIAYGKSRPEAEQWAKLE